MDGRVSETGNFADGGADGGLGSRAWFALGSGRVGARVVTAARIAAALHEAALRDEAEGVGVDERLMLLEGVGAEDVGR